MSKKPQAPLLELMAAVDAGLVAVDVGARNLAPTRRGSYGRSRQTAPVAAAPQTPPAAMDTSFEFSTAVSHSFASPASMVFSDGQLRVHQFPAVRSSPSSSQVASPVLRSSMDSTKAAFAAGGKKRVSFAADGAGKTAAKSSGAHKKGGGLLGCMGSACGMSRDQVVEPAMNGNRKVVLSV